MHIHCNAESRVESMDEDGGEPHDGLHAYLNRVRWKFYTNFLSKCMFIYPFNIRPYNEKGSSDISVGTSTLISQEEYLKLADNFQEIYINAVRRIQSRLDRKALGLNVDALSLSDGTSSENKDKGRNDMKLYIKTTMKWQSICDIQTKVPGDVPDCNGAAKCGAFLRLKFVLKIFMEYFLEQMVYRHDDDDDGPSRSSSSEKAIYVDLFAECLSEYDAVSLLNDFEHIKQHRAGTDELRNCILSGTSAMCCSEFLGRCRRSETMATHDNDDQLRMVKQYLDSLDEKQRVLIEWTSKIHMYFNHKIDEETDALCPNSSSRNITNKFVNEMPTDSISIRGETKMDKLHVILLQCDMPRSDCVELHLLLRDEQFDTDAMIEDLQTRAESNLFQMLTYNELAAKRTLYHLTKLNVFRFGFCRFTHWMHFEGKSDHITSPKYSNLKEEIIQNQVHPISAVKFHRIVTKAIILWQSNKARSLRARDGGLDNGKYEVVARSPLSVSHIVVLLMYCNHTELQNDYKRIGCREMVDIQSFEDPEFSELKKRNMEIAWWHRLITESVLFWGSRARPHHTFYTGLNVPLLFDTFSPNFFSIFSTTVSRGVAYRFSDAKGVILKMVPSAGSWDQFFDVEWISAFDDVLSFASNGILTRNEKYIRAFSLFSSVFRGHFVTVTANTNELDIALSCNLLLVMISRNMMQNGDVRNVWTDSQITPYADQLFNHMMDKFSNGPQKYIIKSEYLYLSDELRHQLLRFDDEDNTLLSPFLMSLSCVLEDFVVMKEYQWIFSDEVLSKFKALKAGQTMYSNGLYSFSGSDGGTVWFQMCVVRQTTGSQYVGFGIVIRRSSYSSIDGLFSVRIDAVNWYRNDYRFYDLRDTEIIFAFDDELLGQISMNNLTIRFAVTMTDAEIKHASPLQVTGANIAKMNEVVFLDCYEEAVSIYNITDINKPASCISEISNVSGHSSIVFNELRGANLREGTPSSILMFD